MKLIKKERLSQMVTDAIKDIIIEENLKPGDKLYSEHQLTQKLEVSRSSIREAIRILEVTGYVKAEQGKGIFITDHEEGQHTVKQWVVDNDDLLREHFEIRLLMEPHAARMAAEKATCKDLEGLEQVYAEFCTFLEQGKISKAISCDSEFHLLVAKMTRNRTLSVLMKTMAQSLNEGWIASLNTPGRLERTVEEHLLLLQAIKDHEPEKAAQAMTAHLQNALNDIQQYTHQW